MERKSLHVYVTDDCEELGTKVFWSGSEWEFIGASYDDDAIFVVYEWNGENQAAVEQKLNENPGVISYQIL